jgi:hypothetical protein
MCFKELSEYFVPRKTGEVLQTYPDTLYRFQLADTLATAG